MTSEAIALIVPDKQLIRVGSLERVGAQPERAKPESPQIVMPKRRGRLFFFDEANISWCPQSGRVYRVVGEAAKVDTPGKRHTKYLLGSLEYPTGAGLYEIYAQKTHAEVRTHWQHLLDLYPDDFLFVVRDNASSHTTPDLDEFLRAQKDRFCLVPLPTYSPHLNVIERVWHYMRDQITRSHFYHTLTVLCEALVQWLQTLPFARFRSLMGLGSDP